MGTVVSLNAGAVAFMHIVKSCEPIIGGLAMSSAANLSFNWVCFGAAMTSNVGTVGRCVYGKKVMGTGTVGENMDQTNTYAVLTVMATVMLVPISLGIEGPAGIVNGFQASYQAYGADFVCWFFFSGIFFYCHQLTAFTVLGHLDVVSHAVVNTMKRVVTILGALIVFQ